MSRILLWSLALAAAVAEECNSMLQTDLRSASGMMSRLDFKHALEQGGSKAIPCIIHQTAKTHTLKEQEAKWAQTWKDMNPKCEYKLWNDTEIAELAQKASPKIIWPIWEGLQPVQRADVFRYLVLWYQGGYYADVDVACKKPVDQYKLPEATNMIVGYEFGHRFPEWQRAQIKFARTEQFQQWFIASAPGNPVLLRCLELIRQRYTWKVESTLELTGPGVFSDAVHEFLEMKSPHAVENEVKVRRHPPDVHFLSYPSESLFGYGQWKMWVFAAGRVNAAPMIAADDPTEAASTRGWDRLPRAVQVTDVSPRDGLQNEAVFVSSSAKLELIRRLRGAGVRSIEATSFVNPKLVPQMADAKEILQSSIKEHAPGCVFPVLVPNAKGLQAALAAGAKEVTLLAAASDTFAQRNTNCTVEENLQRAKAVLEAAKEVQCAVRAAISVCLGCPYEGEVSPKRVAQVACRLLEDGCEEVVVCDTIGTGTAASVWRLLEALEGSGVPMEKVGVHFHDTYGQAVANTLAALQFGVAKVDAAVGGVGGCPFAGPGVSGNVATEDVVQLLHGLGVETGLDLLQLSEAGQWLSSHVLQKGNGSRAGPATLRRHAPSAQARPETAAASGFSSAPLKGLRVLEVGPGLVAGGWTGATLAYFGAEVVKVEPPEVGDGVRKWRKLDGEGTSLWWQSIARNKRSLALDLRQPEGRQLLRQLAGHADVLVENFKPGTLERWDMAPETLRQQNPGLIVARVSGYGQTGPKSRDPGFASVCEGVGGFRFVNGVPGDPPVRPNLSMGDTLAGMNAVLGILLALLKKGQGDGGLAFPGLGQTVDASIAESVLGLLEAMVPEYDFAGEVRQPSGSSLTGIVPTGTYPCKDGTFMIIGANGDSLFKRLMKAMDRAELAEDPRFADNAGRCAHKELLEEAIVQWTSATTAFEVEAACKAASVPCGPIFSIKDIMEDEHFKSRECFEEVQLSGRSIKVPSIGPKLSWSPGRTLSGGPDIGQHSDEILREKLGLSDEQLTALRSQGVVA